MKNNEMEYSTKMNISTILAKGKIGEYYWAVVNYGTHPCCYIGLPKGHKFYKKSYVDIENQLSVHGGLTFSGDLHFNPVDIDLWWLGWDYAHYGDYMGYYGLPEMKELQKKYPSLTDKKWTTKELIMDIKGAIKQLQHLK